MDPMYQKLIGELIGLARATEGNEHLISEASTAVIRASLKAKSSGEEAISQLIDRVITVKQSMVPNCFLCASPCGRTSAYDLSHIAQEEPDVQEMKCRILNELEAIAENRPESISELVLYRGLSAIGLEGFDPDALYRIFKAE